MTAAVRLIQWTCRRERLGDNHPETRGAFGRYVAAKGGWLGWSAGAAAYVAWARAREPGFQNRRLRKHLGLEPLPSWRAAAP